MSILTVNHVSVRYLSGDFKDIGLKEYVLRKLTGNYQVQEFWADYDIHFSLEQGDMLGIIGTNGAGKSTLLKVITGIMEPTKGYVKRQGRIAALLELASGFDGQLTVRENTYLRGAMLGYTRKFMNQMYDQIISFAELEDFQDRPFKQLSSGMKSRLAFSIASLVRPDILILDEVLSVGDGAFREKSEAKMREIIGSGATTILVSHSIRQVRGMCSKILWLHKGKQVAFGEDVQMLCDAYEEFLRTGVLPGSREELEQMAGSFINQKTAKCRDLKAPEVTLRLNERGKPYLIWNEVEGAKNYAIFRSVGNTEEFVELMTTAYINFTNISAVPGETYYYKVCAMNRSGRGKFSNTESITSR